MVDPEKGLFVLPISCTEIQIKKTGLSFFFFFFPLEKKNKKK